jgi:hypothetical protein
MAALSITVTLAGVFSSALSRKSEVTIISSIALSIAEPITGSIAESIAGSAITDMEGASKVAASKDKNGVIIL